MSNWELNLTGNLEGRSLSSAGAVNTLTVALKAEEKALASAKVAAARTAAGLDPKQYARASSAVKEATTRIARLRSESAKLAPSGARDRRYDSTANGPLKSFAIGAPKAAASFKELKAPSEILTKIKEKASSAAKAIGSGLGNAAKATGAVMATSLVVGTTLAIAGATLLASKLYNVGKTAITLGVSFADEARSARLMNEAADIAGGTHSQLSGIIEDVNRRATIGKERLAGMGRELRLLRFDSRQTQLTLDAMGVAESALGQGASSAVRGIAEQSRAMRRFSLGIRDAYGEYESLKATGLTKGEVFSALAGQLKISTAAVQREVQLGHVSVTKGMLAIDTALNRKFGANVAKQAIGIDRTFAKLKENFVAMFAGANIEPLLNGLNSITSLFSRDTAEGKAFGEIVSRVMNELGKTAESLTPQIKEFIVGLGADAAKPGGLAETIKGWIADAKELGSSLKSIAEAIKSIGSAASSVSGAIQGMKDWSNNKKSAADEEANNKQFRIENELMRQGKDEGQTLTAGIASGVIAGGPAAVKSITDLSHDMQTAFQTANKIHSPSRVYHEQSMQIPAGTAGGVREGTPRAVASIDAMSSAMLGAFDAAPSGAPSPPSQSRTEVNQIIHIHGIPGSEEIGPALVRWTKYAVDGGPRPAFV